MARRIVLKYPFGENDKIEFPWSWSSRIVLVAAQRPSDPYPTVWVEHPADDGARIDAIRDATFYPTGSVYDDRSEEWIGTAVCKNGALVWHVTASRVEQPF